MQHHCPWQWLPDFAWFCLILPGNEGLILLEIAWFCLILPETAWFCLKLPEGCLNLSLERRKQITMTWKPENDWFCLMCFLFCLELSENAGKEWGRWATLLPRVLGLSIIGKQTLIMNIANSDYEYVNLFFLFEGLYFCFRKREKEFANRLGLGIGLWAEGWPKSFWQPERVFSRNHYHMDSSFFWLSNSISPCGMDMGNAQLWDHCWGNEHAVQLLERCLILPGLAWHGLKMPDFAWSQKRSRTKKHQELLNDHYGILQERQFSEEVRAIQWTAGLWKTWIFLHSCPSHLSSKQGTSRTGPWTRSGTSRTNKEGKQVYWKPFSLLCAHQGQEPNKGINIKNLGRNSPPRPPPLQRDPWPRKFFMFGASFPFRKQEKAYIENFEGGSWGPQNSLCWISSRVFFLHLTRGTCNSRLLRRVLRRFFKGSASSIRRILWKHLVRVSVGTRVLRRVRRRGHRKRLEGA